MAIAPGLGAQSLGRGLQEGLAGRGSGLEGVGGVGEESGDCLATMTMIRLTFTKH